jgi:hypothetical protein
MTTPEVEALLEVNPEDSESKIAEAVDAALRCWVLSKQTNGEAVHMAVSLLPSADPDGGLPLDETDHICVAAALIREELEEQMGLGSDDDPL